MPQTISSTLDAAVVISIEYSSDGASWPQSTRIVQLKRRPTSNVDSMMVLRARRGRQDVQSEDTMGAAEEDGQRLFVIPVEESFAAWRKDPKYVKSYNAIEDEFSLAKAMIEARAPMRASRRRSSPSA
jgi:hypothetical protein